MTRKVWLSLDWDFFCREEPEWDWGHSEDGNIYQTIAWNIRATTALARGIDLRKETSLQHSKPAPARFWRSLERLGFNFDRVLGLGIADSHRHAYRFFKELPDAQATQIVHIDAHHDLFYSVPSLKHSDENDDPRCDDWHLLTLLRGKLRSLVVYPQWKGLCEWEDLLETITSVDTQSSWATARMLQKIVDTCVWGDPHVPAVAGEVEGIFICRSGAWVPPWHDLAFNRFVQAAEDIAGEDSVVYGEDPRIRRPFNWRSVQHFADKMRQELG